VTIRLGSGPHTYELVPGWGRLPAGWDLGDVAAVAVDSRDRVFVFNRGEHPMIIFDRDGNFENSWGEGFFTHAHGIFLAADQSLYCTDDGNHAVTVHAADGQLLMQIGLTGQPAPFHSGTPFNRCTHTALSPEGDIYVSDGYGNARVHKYAPDGRLLLSWGGSGMAAGEFNLPHNIVCDEDGWVYVADRENHRIQVFDGNGKFETSWRDVVHRPCALHRTSGPDPMFLVGELGPSMDFNRGAPNLGPRLSVLSGSGNLLTRLEVTPAMGTGPGQFIAPHGIATDSRGDIYVAEVSVTGWPQLFPDQPMPRPVRSLQKLARVSL
jgi:DNA-binding beta-propeller fold protein YncE